jgi:hypothetical protein
MKTIILAVLSLSFLGGCAGAYTSIRKVDDKTYVITRTKQGFLRTYGTVFVCTPAGETANLTCTEIDSP